MTTKEQMSRDDSGRVFRWIAFKFGYMLLPLREIEQMEKDSRSDYDCMRTRTFERDRGYFNGMADYASKTAHNFKEKYL